MEARFSSKKSCVRQAVRHRRRLVTPGERRRWSRQIVARLASLPEFSAGQHIALYSSLADEAETEALFSAARAAQKAVYYPVVGTSRKPLTFHRVEDLAELRPGYRGIREPVGGEEHPPQAMDLVIVPGVAFDRQGHRVGRGGGWYDRSLAGVQGCRIGLAFECQLVDRVPAEAHDQQVDLIVTEQRVIRCRGGKGSRTRQGG